MFKNPYLFISGFVALSLVSYGLLDLIMGVPHPEPPIWIMAALAAGGVGTAIWSAGSRKQRTE